MVEQLADVPSLSADPASEAEAFVRSLAGDNGPARYASFASEAGQFQNAGFPTTVLCGPGSIDQACTSRTNTSMWLRWSAAREFMARLIEALRRLSAHCAASRTAPSSSSQPRFGCRDQGGISRCCR